MPNWCENRMRVVGPTEAVDEFIAGAEGDEKVGNTLSILRNYLPFPPALEGEIREANGETYSVFTNRGYEWCLTNWGCKWGDNGTRVIQDEILNNGNTKCVTIYMDTPWGPPAHGIERISAIFPELTFTLAYHEAGMDFSGVVKFANGATVIDFDYGSPPQYEEDNDDAWADEIELMYERLFAMAFPERQDA